MKTCSKCNKRKREKSFYKDAQKLDGFRPSCKICDEVTAKIWRQKLRELRPDARRSIILKYKYKITLDDYNALLKAQKLKCKICKTKNPKTRTGVFVVDHCHKTGKVRGLLCLNCNIGLGGFLDNVESLKEAIWYLRV